jgi:Bacterial membrane protein YfhO
MSLAAPALNRIDSRRLALTSFWHPYGLLAAVLSLDVWPAWGSATQLIVGGDSLLIHYPWFVFWRQELAARVWPWWNPYTLGGLPAFATPQAGIGYPVHWLLSWLPAVLALNWAVGLHVVLAGLGTAWCAGRLGASRDGQLLAGLAYALGSASVARMWAGHLSFLEANAWLPVATGCALRLRSQRDVVWLAAAVGMLSLAAQPELLIFALWWLPAWALAAATRATDWSADPWRAGVRSLLRTGVGLSLGVALAAFQLLPSALLLGSSNRAEAMDWGLRTDASLPPWHLLTALVPTAFGDPRDSMYWAGDWYAWHERLLYVGVVPLLAAVCAPGRWRRICLGLVLAAIALAFGHFTFWYAWADVLPGYQSFRIPSKHLVLAALALALAAGLGLERLRGRRVAVGAAAAAISLLGLSATSGLWLPWATTHLGDAAQPDAYIPLAAVGPAVILLLLVGLSTLWPAIWARRGLLALAAADLILVLGPYRLVPTDPEALAGTLRQVGALTRVAVLGDQGPLLGNYGPVAGVQMPTGYTSLFARGYAELVTGAPDPPVLIEVTAADLPVLRLLGYPATFDPEIHEVARLEPEPPAAWVARCARPGGPAEARAEDFPLTQCVTVADMPAEDAAQPAGQATVTAAGQNWLTFSADGPGWLVTPEPWYPGWAASVDGRPQPVDRIDGALVGAQLSKGRHTVELRYVPAGLLPGMLISLGAAGLLVVLWRWSARPLPSWVVVLGRWLYRAWRQ